MVDAHALWRKSRGTLAKDDPTPGAVIFENPPNPDTEGRQIAGYWRQVGGKTKPDVPVLIWPAAENPEVMTWQEGARTPKNTDHHLEDWLRFLDMGAGKMVAVTKAEYSKALTTGFWSDGKKSRDMSEAERLDVIPTTPAEDGGNMSEDLAAQYDAKIKAQIEKIEALGGVVDQDKANAAAQIITDLRSLWKMADNQRQTEKRPHDEAAAAVQARFKPMLDTAELAAKKLLAAVDGWQKAEQRRLQREAEEKARVERERVQRETAERLAREAEERRKELEEAGASAEEVSAAAPSADDIEARAAEVAAETVVTETVAKPVASGAYSRAVSKTAKKVGKITDLDAFIGAIKDQDDFLAWCQDKANKLARANTRLAGMTIEVE